MTALLDFSYIWKGNKGRRALRSAAKGSAFGNRDFLKKIE